MNSFNRWLRSRNGMTTLIAALLVLVVVGVIWGVSSQGSTVTPTPTPPHFVAPIGGYTCLPTCAEDDGRFLANVSADMKSFGGSKTVVWIGVPGDYTSFEVGVFDGDSGKDNSGAFNYLGGNWDYQIGEVLYKLYVDATMSGQTTTLVQTWSSNDMPNNAWFTGSVNVSAEAKAPSGHYFYRLEVETPLTPAGLGRYKLRSNAYLVAGDPTGSGYSLPLTSGSAYPLDIPILWPQWQGYANPGSSKYTGQWQFTFYVTNDATSLEIWDGDFDRGTSKTVAQDTDDPNTEGKPAWAGPFTLDEGFGGQGIPSDDSPSVLARRSPAVRYQVTDPDNTPIYTNEEPSGTEEWEKYMLATDAALNPDLLVTKIQPGFYNVNIEGLDLGNTSWLYVDKLVCDAEDGCGPTVWKEGICPRTIGYWKNNVKKVLIEGRTRGVQETADSIHDGLTFIAQVSPLYRTGINVAAPVAIASPVRLTDQEADAILQKTAGNSMLDRALQQNLATWLNLATGKIGPTTWIRLEGIAGGTYEGTVMDALLEAQTLILSNTNLERAKDIADMINNNNLNVDPADALPCTDYEKIVPPAKQPPSHDKMPKAPKKDEVGEVPPAPDPVCSAGNTYTVENPTNNPFESVKFNFVSGTEVKGGGYDTFVYTLPADVVASMTSMQIEVKAATNSQIITLACDFTSPLGCGEPVMSGDNVYGVSFNGVTENADGSLSLTFTVLVYGEHGLSHVAFELPMGVVALNVEQNYTSQVCVAP